jgi:hypothetical protein
MGTTQNTGRDTGRDPGWNPGWCTLAPDRVAWRPSGTSARSRSST